MILKKILIKTMRPNTIQVAEKYIDDVRSGKVLACRYVKKAVDRHVQDLQTGIDRGLNFNKTKAARALRFFNHLRHFKGAFYDKPFVLSPWQAFIVYSLFGWEKSDGTRRFTEAYIEVARKNGKTTLAAAIALILLVIDNEPGAEIFSIATKQGQAMKTVEEAQGILSVSHGVAEQLQVNRYAIYQESTMSKFIALASDSKKEDSHNAHGVINDEYHAHPDDRLYHVMKSSMGARRQPLFVTITTAGFDRQSACYKLRRVMIDILDEKVRQDNRFAIIYTLDEGDDWKDPQVWVKANPNLDVGVNRKYIENEMASAVLSETDRVNFMTKMLNVWTDSAMSWIPDDQWMECDLGLFTPDMVAGREGYGGFDLSSTRDITAFQAVVQREGCEVLDVVSCFWIPEVKVKERADYVDYLQWVNDGYVFTCPGGSIDNDQVAAQVLEVIGRYNVVSSAFDSWGVKLSGIAKVLQDEGVLLSEFGQGYKSMSFPMKEMERMIVRRQLNHQGNPVLRWMNGNVVITRDPAGNIKMDKGKAHEKIDGMVALVMAIGEFLTYKMQANEDINDIYRDGFR